ncbi:hypothetical protein [Corynebacterium sp. LaCa116]|uniref:hypothetical protein n=1 Tax=Corynebacterium sp. LaCa116 TaxID=3391423 RepID=UPI003988B4A6
MTGPQIALTDRPDLGAALKRAGDSETVHAAAAAVIEGLGVDEIVLEAAATKASGVDGAAFVTNRRILVTADKKNPSHFEFLELDNLGNVTVLPYKDGWAVVAQLYSTYKVWSGFTEKAARRVQFAAQWALTAGREARTEASRAVSSEELFKRWKENKHRLNRDSVEARVESMHSLYSDIDSRWWTE